MAAKPFLVIIGIFELFLGVGILVCGIVEIIQRTHLHEYSHGFWGGAAFLILSALAVMGGTTKGKAYLAGHVGMGLFTVLVVFPLMVIILRSELVHDGPAKLSMGYCNGGCRDGIDDHSHHADNDLIVYRVNVTIRLDQTIDEDAFSEVAKDVIANHRYRAPFNEYASQSLYRCDDPYWTRECRVKSGQVKTEIAMLGLTIFATIMTIISTCNAAFSSFTESGEGVDKNSVTPKSSQLLSVPTVTSYNIFTTTPRPDAQPVRAPGPTMVFPSAGEAARLQVPPLNYVPSADELDSHQPPNVHYPVPLDKNKISARSVHSLQPTQSYVLVTPKSDQVNE